MDKMLYTVKEVAIKLGCYKVRAETLEKFLAESEGKDLTDLAAIKELPTEK